MAPSPPDRSSARSPGRGPATVLATALLVSLALAGCATLGGAPGPAPAVAPPVALAAAVADSDTLAVGPVPAWWDDRSDPELSPERIAWLAAHPEVRDLEDAYRQVVALVARGLLDPADDMLYLLRKQTAVGAKSANDSLTISYRQSLDRRLILLAGLLAEERSLRGDYAPSDSLLEEAYSDIRGLVLPDTLAPVPQGAHQAMLDLLKIDNAMVQEWLAYFTGPARKHMARWLERRAEIEPVVSEILTEAGLPPELFYMSIIESGLSAHARSRVGAVGYWQFMTGTARHFSLRTDGWLDERRDIERSTRAAATYLSQLYSYFQDWALVLAAYNAGEGRVDRVIRRVGIRDFWRLPLPTETRNHIPKFIAAYRICQDPTAYGFAVARPAPVPFDTVRVADVTDLRVVARCAGVSPDTVRALNPALVRGVTPPGRPGYAVRVPAGTGALCAQQLAQVPAGERLVWARHTVKRGDTLRSVANRYGVTITQLREANRLGRSPKLQAGEILLVPQTGEKRAAAAAQARPARGGAQASAGDVVDADEAPDGHERVIYRVEKGDTLARIARKLGVSIDHLTKINGLRRTSVLQPGQRLKADRPTGRARSG